MDTKQAEAKSLKKGSSVVFDGVACVVRSIQLSKPGKHGAKKARIEAVGMINGEKKIKIMPASENIDVPIIGKNAAQVLSTSGETCNVMDMETFETFDLKIPEELKPEIKEGIQIVYYSILGERILKQVKTN